MSAYYNEIDPFAAQWLRNLIQAGHIAPGEVDERSIEDVRPNDVRGFTQCHWFAGIGGWSYALRLAGWADDREVWTGSCPCQGFSVAGLQRGFSDPRHLWPAWFKLISECKPPVVLGEQVAAAIRLGWLDLVQADLEGKDYTLGKSVLGAHGVGAPHIRQRLWFVADARSKGRWEDTGGPSPHEVENGGARRNQLQPDGDNKFVRYGSNGMAHASCEQFNGGRNAGAYGRDESPDSGGACTVEHAERAAESRLGCISVPLESKQETGLPGYANPWQDCELIQCSDGKARPTQPGLQPLAYGVSGRLGRLRAYGNAIVPQVAAEFIASYMEIGGTP